MKKRFSDEQIISIIRKAEAGVSARELNGVLNNRPFSGFIGPMLRLGTPTVLIDQRDNAAFFRQLL